MLARSGVVLALLASSSLAEVKAADGNLQEKIRKLVGDLGNASYQSRERAQSELIEIGPPAIGALEAAVRSGDEEVRQRAQKALAEVHANARRRARQAIARNLLWKAPAWAGAIGRPLAAGKRILYVQRGEPPLVTADARTGKSLWGSDVQGHPLVAGKTVYLKDTRGRLRALDLATGKAPGEFTPRAVEGLPAFAGGVLYVGGQRESFLALDAATGREMWRVHLPKGADSGVRPVVAAGCVHVAATDGAIYALACQDGQRKWAAPVGKGRLRCLASHRGLLIARSQSALHGLAVDTGRPAWEFPIPSGAAPAGLGVVRIRQRIVVKWHEMVLDSSDFDAPGSVVSADGVLYLTVGDRLVGVDAATGKEKWAHRPEFGSPGKPGGPHVIQLQQGGAQLRIVVAGNAIGVGASPGAGLTDPAAADGVLYFGSREGLHAVDVKTGQEIWRFATATPVSGPPAIADGVIYFGTSRALVGGLLAFHEQAVTGPENAQVLAEQEGVAQGPGVYAVRVKGRR